MTNQELYDTVVAKMHEQGEPSLNSGGHCAYRGLHARACAIGCLIKDEHYDPAFEKHSIVTNSVRHAVEASLGYKLPPKQIRLLGDLQSLHDSWERGVPFPEMTPHDKNRYGIK